MTAPQPIYRSNNTNAAYQLNWSLSIFWRGAAINPDDWLGELKSATETDGVRILEHRLDEDNVSQFLVSTTPAVSPSELIRLLGVVLVCGDWS